jgi:hypothetical protein
MPSAVAAAGTAFANEVSLRRVAEHKGDSISAPADEVRLRHDEPAEAGPEEKAVALRAADGVFTHIVCAFADCSGDDGRALERGFERLQQESAAADSGASV